MKLSRKTSRSIMAVLGALVLGLPWMTNGAEAGTRTFRCPSMTIATGIREPVPYPWSRVSRPGALRWARVEPIGGGRSRLVCDYGPAGQLTRIVLPPWRCTAAGRAHFRCTDGRRPPPPPPPPPGPRVVASGRVTIPFGRAADLDTGRMGGPGADIRNRTPGGIHAINGAQIAAWRGRGMPDRAACERQRFSAGEGLSFNPDRPSAKVFCVRTNAGNMSVIRFIGGRPGPGGNIRFSYRTWD